MTARSSPDRRQPGPATGLGTARRLDWRFLLPATADGRQVATLRLLCDDPGLADEVTRLGVAATVLVGADDLEPVDAVVALADAWQDRALDRALGTLREGGVVYVEIDRASARGPGRGPAGLRRRLAHRGVASVAYWRRRQGRHDTLVLPLDVPGAVPWFLRELADGAGRRRRVVRRGLMLLVGRSGRRLGLLARHHAAVGVRVGATTPAPTTPAVLMGSAHGTAPSGAHGTASSGAHGTAPSGAYGTVLPVVLARGEGAWSRVVLLPFGEQDGRPRAVVKVPRSSEHCWATEREQETLAQVRRLLPDDLALTVPAPLGTRTWHGLCVAEETFLAGRPLALSPASRDPGTSGTGASGAGLDGAVDWLIAFHRATRTHDLPTSDLADSLETSLTELARTLGSAPASGGPTTSAWPVQALRGTGAVVPVVWQHGDLTPHNTRWDGRRHTVVDWEAARPGPALADLLYLLLHWRWPGLPTLGADPGAVLDALFLTRHGGTAAAAARQVRRYCAALDMDEALVGPLLVHLLCSQALDRARRTRDGGQDPAADENLYAALLRLVLDAPGPVPAWESP